MQNLDYLFYLFLKYERIILTYSPNQSEKLSPQDQTQTIFFPSNLLLIHSLLDLVQIHLE